MKEVAIAAAYAAGEIQKSHYGKMLNVDEAKRHDVKLEVDKLCEEAIIKTIHSTYPDHSVLAEESGESVLGGDYKWIVDPLDGTVNFFYGLPYFCTSIACYRSTGNVDSDDISALGEPVVGVIFVPPMDEMFVGVHGEGATMNGEPIRASSVDKLSEAIITKGFGNTEDSVQRGLDVSTALIDKVRKTRCMGSASCDLVNVACGRLTGYYERGVFDWDIAAGRIIVEESGGVFDAKKYDGTRWDVLACGAGIHEELKNALG